MTAEDVDRAIIRPMCRLYPPPRHLRCDEDNLDVALTAYRRALARFDQDVLERAWQSVVEQNPLWCWPKLADIVQAAEQAQRAAEPKPDAWVDRVTALSDEYTRRFMKRSAHAARAKEGGYESELRQYVSAAAHVQSQMICGQQGVGYESAILFGSGLGRDREAEAAFFARARQQAETGQIRVTIPPARVKLWQKQAQSQGQSQGVQR